MDEKVGVKICWSAQLKRVSEMFSKMLNMHCLLNRLENLIFNILKADTSYTSIK